MSQLDDQHGPDSMRKLHLPTRPAFVSMELFDLLMTSLYHVLGLGLSLHVTVDLRKILSTVSDVDPSGFQANFEIHIL